MFVNDILSFFFVILLDFFLILIEYHNKKTKQKDWLFCIRIMLKSPKSLQAY